jgi:hypothetical protein
MTSTKVPIVEDLKAISVITNYMGATYSFLYQRLGPSNFGTRRTFYGKKVAFGTLAWSKKMQAAGWPILNEIDLPVRRQKEPKALVFRGQLVKF